MTGKCQQMVENDVSAFCQSGKCTTQVSCCREHRSLTTSVRLITPFTWRPYCSCPPLSQKPKAEGYLFWPIPVGCGVLSKDDLGFIPWLSQNCAAVRILLLSLPSLFFLFCQVLGLLSWTNNLSLFLLPVFNHSYLVPPKHLFHD